MCSAPPRSARCSAISFRRRARRAVRRAKPALPHFAAEGEERHLSAHGRRPFADGPLRLQAGDGEDGTTRICRTASARASGSPTMTSGQARFPDRAVEVQVRARHGQCGMWMNTNCCRRPRSAWTTWLSSARCTPRRSITSRPSPRCRPATQIAGRPCIGSWAQLRPRLAESKPADLRRARRRADATREQIQAISGGCGRAASCPASMPA